jgi:hypothetical protein
LPKIAEIEKQRLLASDGEGESKYPKGVCVTTPLKQLVSEELPESAIKTDQSPGSFDYAPLSFQRDKRLEALRSGRQILGFPSCPLW